MSNEMINFAEAQLPAPVVSEEALEKASLTSDFLPQFKLMTEANGVVKERKASAGNWALCPTKDTVEELGENVLALPLRVRPLAIDYNGGVESTYDPDTEKFQEIAQAAKGENSGCVAGNQFLLYLLDSNGKGVYATWHATQKSAKMARKACKSALDNTQAVIFSHELVRGKYTYLAPVVVPTEETLELSANFLDIIHAFDAPVLEELEANGSGSAASEERPR